MVIIFSSESGDMVPYLANGRDAVKLGVHAVNLIISLPGLSEDIDNVGRVHISDVHVQPEILDYGQFHKEFSVKDVVHPGQSVDVLHVEWFEAKGESSFFKPLFNDFFPDLKRGQGHSRWSGSFMHWVWSGNIGLRVWKSWRRRKG